MRGCRVRIRAWETGDEAILREVFDGLGETSRYRRYHAPVSRLSGGMLRGLLAVDGTTHVALVAEIRVGRRWVPAGIGRFVRRASDGSAEIAIEVVDGFHRRGVGTALIRALRQRALELGYATLVAEVLVENEAMLGLLQRELPARWVRRHGTTVTVTCPLVPEAVVLTADDVLPDVA
jgi:GNAT superfamily N-acetyltransferase